MPRSQRSGTCSSRLRDPTEVQCSCTSSYCRPIVTGYSTSDSGLRGKESGTRRYPLESITAWLYTPNCSRAFLRHLLRLVADTLALFACSTSTYSCCSTVNGSPSVRDHHIHSQHLASPQHPLYISCQRRQDCLAQIPPNARFGTTS